MTRAKTRILAIAIGAALATGPIPNPARADLFGGDVAVLAGILTETINQGIQLANQLERLHEQVENGKQVLMGLKNVRGFTDGIAYYNNLRFDYDSLKGDVRAMSFRAQEVRSDFDRLFPRNVRAWQGVSEGQFQSRYAAWNEELTSSAAIAARVQTQLTDVQGLNDRAQHALFLSQTEGGVVGQLQAMNQMLSVMQSQMNTLVQVLATGSRVTSDMAAATAGKDMLLQESKRHRLEGYTNPGPPPRELSRLPPIGR
jgi:P-type conjugative transfer protein TrbJ